MLIFVWTNNVWGPCHSICFGISKCRWLECLVNCTLRGDASEPGVMAQISISCASYLASLTPSRDVHICLDQQCMRPSSFHLLWFFRMLMIRMFGHLYTWRRGQWTWCDDTNINLLCILLGFTDAFSKCSYLFRPTKYEAFHLVHNSYLSLIWVGTS